MKNRKTKKLKYKSIKKYKENQIKNFKIFSSLVAKGILNITTNIVSNEDKEFILKELRK